MTTPIPAEDLPKACECQGWARAIAMDYLTDHHPNCKHYNDSLVDAWQVESGGTKCIVEHEQDAKDTAGEDPECKVTPVKIHREVLESMPEFNGF